MNSNICRNCGSQLVEGTCNNCGYTARAKEPFENGIKNRELKEQLADTALSLLASHKFISLEKDLNHLVVEFGYLLLPKDSDKVSALIKVITPKKIFQPSKVFYLGTQDGNMMLLNEKFNEEMFRKVSYDMLTMHGVDLNTINKNEYIMELY